MDAQLTLKQLMSQELDPKQVDLRARFQNAQIAVDSAYRLAQKMAYVPDTKALNPDWKEGEPSHAKWDYVTASTEQNVAEVVKVARLLKIEIEKDLNETLKVLEVSDGAKLSKEIPQ